MLCTAQSSLRAPSGEALRDKHVNTRPAERPVNQEGRIWEFVGSALQFNGLVPHDPDPIGGSLRLEKRFKLSRRLYHHNSDKGDRSSMKG
jgi:hypothetical protein